MWPAPFLLFGTFHPLLPNVTCCSVWAPRAPEGQPCCVTGVMSLCSRKTCRPLVTRARRPHPSGASPGPSFHACGQCVSLPSGSLSAQLPARALCPGKALGEGGGLMFAESSSSLSSSVLILIDRDSDHLAWIPALRRQQWPPSGCCSLQADSSKAEWWAVGASRC